MKQIQVLLLMGGMVILFMSQASYGRDDDAGVVRTGSDNISIRVGGTMQTRLTYAIDGGVNELEESTSRLGFGIRRTRFLIYTDIGDRIGLFFQMEGSGGTVSWLDLRGEYRIGDKTVLRMGRFVGAQPRAFARTSHSKADGVDLPVIAEKWGRMTIGSDGRDYGVEANWYLSEFELRAFVHNGYNKFNYCSAIGQEPVTGGVNTDGLAVSLAGTYKPGALENIEMGGFASLNTSRNPLTAVDGVGRNYFSYSFHSYWGPLPGDQAVRLKADVIGIQYQEVEPFGSENSIGASFFGGVLAAPHIEIFARGEYWHSDRGGRESVEAIYGTAGGTFSLSALKGDPFVANRISLAYSLRTQHCDDMSLDRNPAHVFMVHTQFCF